MSTALPFFTDVCIKGRDLRLECQWVSSERTDKPLIVFLHEGLGSIAILEDWPQKLCDALGYRGLVYSRYGYGRSTPRPAGEPWPFDYMHEEAADTLPALLRALNVDVARDRPLLYGHSDGGTIALIHAALYPEAVRAIIVAAPHINVEEIGQGRIRKVREAYRTTNLPQKLARFHDDPDPIFWGWSDLWLNPDYHGWNIMSLLPQIRCPILAAQGEEDGYATLEQIYGIRRCAPQTEVLVLSNCRHVPHQDQPEKLMGAIAGFVNTV